MTRDDIRLLYEYERWAHSRVFTAVSALAPEQFTRDLGGSFHSVRNTLLHMIGGAWSWLRVWKEVSDGPGYLAELRARRDAIFPPDAFPSVAAVQSKWAEIEKEEAEFVNSLTDQSLERLVAFRGSRVSLAGLMQHLVNHSTYHRGQLTLMLRQLGADPIATDFHVFLMETRSEAAGGHSS